MMKMIGLLLLLQLIHICTTIPLVPILPLYQSSIRHYHTQMSIYANISRIVVIADVHDDLKRFKNILEDAQIINTENEWIAEKNTVVVQLGDQIDKKHVDNDDIHNKHHFRVTYYTDYLKTIALQNGCDFISMIGNHEHMNLEKIQQKDALKDIISKRPVVAIINNYLFCHGGFVQHHYDMLKEYHMNIKDLNEIWYKYVNGIELKAYETTILDNLITDKESGILYIRNLGDKYDNNKLFIQLGIDYMFVGHSETKNIFVRNRVWYLDQILKLAFDDNIYNYIDIRENNITIRSLSDK